MKPLATLVNLEQLQSTASPSMPQPSTTTGPRTSDAPEFSREERDRTGYFFLRLRTVFGSRYALQYPTEQAIVAAKREWARQIGRYSREQIDAMFEAVKASQMAGSDEHQWPDVAKIIATLSGSWQHRAQSRPAAEIIAETHRIPDLAARERAIAARDSQREHIRMLLAEVAA